MKDEQLYAFVADARARTAADVRRRTRSLHDQLRADMSLAALFGDLVRSGAAVEVALPSGRAHRGQLTGTGGDVLVLERTAGGVAHVAERAVQGVRVLAPAGDPGSGAATGVAPAPEVAPLRGTELFADVVADLADERVEVELGTGDRVYMGRLGGLARDFVWFDDTGHCVRLDAITDVVVRIAS